VDFPYTTLRREKKGFKGYAYKIRIFTAKSKKFQYKASFSRAPAFTAIMKNKLREAQQARGAQGIEAESPQDLHKQIRGLEAESPVFGALRQKCAIIQGKK
jgi:hypothetical protein